MYESNPRRSGAPLASLERTSDYSRRCFLFLQPWAQDVAGFSCAKIAVPVAPSLLQGPLLLPVAANRGPSLSSRLPCSAVQVYSNHPPSILQESPAVECSLRNFAA